MFSDSRFWIGALVGAAAVYFLLPKLGAMTGGSSTKKRPQQGG